MPALAVSSSTGLFSPFRAWWTGEPDAQGIEGKKVSAKAEEVYRHWNQRIEALITPDEDAAEYAYTSPPPNREFCVETHYVYAGKGVPLPFDLDDE